MEKIEAPDRGLNGVVLILFLNLGGFWLWNCARDLRKKKRKCWNLLQCFCHDDSACLSCHNCGRSLDPVMILARPVVVESVFDAVGQNFVKVLCKYACRVLWNDTVLHAIMKVREKLMDFTIKSIGLVNIFKKLLQKQKKVNIFKNLLWKKLLCNWFKKIYFS